MLILLYLAAPKTEWTFYLLAVGLGFSWLGTAPPTAGVVGKLFGMRYLATLYGMTMLSHQIGGFFGAWLGGLAFSYYGNYLWMWYADALFALIAGLLNLPIREPRLGATSAKRRWPRQAPVGLGPGPERAAARLAGAAVRA